MKRLIGVFVVTAAAVEPTAGLVIPAQINAPSQTTAPAQSNARTQTTAAKPAPPSTEWPTYGHDPGGMRFSPLTQITPANVGQLQVAWVYHMRPDGHRRPPPGAGAAAPAAGAAADAAARASPRARPRRSSSTA